MAPSLRILHTADWHLGHSLHGMSREYEHDRFLEWLVARLVSESVDALLIAGDIFDSGNPPAEAQSQWFRFLAAARRAVPALDIVAVAGNHDSAARLEAPDPILRELGVRVVGAVPATVDRLIVPLHDRGGAAAALCVAVPFLRIPDLPAVEPGADGRLDPLIEGVRRVYAKVLDAARSARRGGQAIIATGHLYMSGTAISEISERKILGGNLHALPADIIPADVAYAALGHLHLAQAVGARDAVRYSGSPIPLSFPEATYKHEVRIIDLDGERLAGPTRAVEVPRFVPLLTVPRAGARPLAEVLAALHALDPLDPAEPEDERPFLEVRVLLDAPEPTLRRQVEAALEGRAARLLKLTSSYAGTGEALADAAPTMGLRDISIEEVFLRRYARDFEGPPAEPLLAAFHEIREACEGGSAA